MLVAKTMDWTEWQRLEDLEEAAAEAVLLMGATNRSHANKLALLPAVVARLAEFLPLPCEASPVEAPHAPLGSVGD